MKKNIKFFIVVIAALIFSSCSSDTFEMKPYYISGVEVQTGPQDGLCNFACASLDFFNNSDKEIESLTISARLYDSEGECVSYGVSGLSSVYTNSILPKSTEKIIISLDEIVGPEIEDSYILDFIYAKEIKYSDGSLWSDPLGFYCF